MPKVERVSVENLASKFLIDVEQFASFAVLDINFANGNVAFGDENLICN